MMSAAGHYVTGSASPMRFFYDESKISLLPMDFYYPGKNPKGGDLPPRKDFANLWHPQILQLMPSVELTILVGGYAQNKWFAKDVLPELRALVVDILKESP